MPNALLDRPSGQEFTTSPEQEGIPSHIPEAAGQLGVAYGLEHVEEDAILSPESAQIAPEAFTFDEERQDTIAIPAKFDEMPPGTYKSENSDRTLSVTETEYGRVIHDSDRASPLGHIRMRKGGSTQLMSELGYQITDGEITGVPTPATVAKRAEALGVPVMLDDEAGVFGADAYLKAFADGKYPISTQHEEWFSHDINDDHLTAMVLGGEELRTTLATTAQAALERAEGISDELFEAEKNKTTEYIDTFTNKLRYTLTHPEESDRNAQRTQEEHYVDLIHSGYKLGLTDEQIDSIISNSYEAAKQYGLVPEEASWQTQKDQVFDEYNIERMKEKFQRTS